MLNNINTKGRGFTIVELLIVIVVIAILAAISIVAYNGIQARGKTSSAQSSASNVIKKAELYNTDVGNYPLTFAAMSGAASTTVYKIDGVSHVTSLSNTSESNQVIYRVCGSGSPAAYVNVTTANIVGVQVQYRDYQGAGSNVTLNGGTTSGTGIACHTSTS